MIVRAKPDLIESALKHCPPQYPLAARDPQQDLQLDGNHVYLGTDGCGVEVLDLISGQRRMSCLQDVREIAWIADATEQIAFHWVPVSAQDVPAGTRGLHEIKAIWENSTKHVQTESIYNAREAEAAIEMASMLAGGSEELRRRPVLSLMQCTASPLGHDGGSVEAALLAAEAGIPTGFHDDGSLPDDRASHTGGQSRRRECRGAGRHGTAAAGISGRPGVLRRGADRVRSAHRRLHRRRPGGFPVRRCHKCARGLLQYPAFDGIIRHGRQAAELAGGG